MRLQQIDIITKYLKRKKNINRKMILLTIRCAADQTTYKHCGEKTKLDIFRIKLLHGMYYLLVN